MDIVIAIIGIALAIYVDRRKKQKRGQQQTVKSNVQNVGRPNVQNANRQKVQTQMKSTIQTAQNTMQRNMTQTQRELKERLQQKYGNVAQQSKTAQQVPRRENMQQYEQKPQQAKQEDILSRAAANVQEKAEDELRQENCGMPEIAVDILQFGMSENSELMREISDLMIMGYAGELSFERDFVAEGVTMLNSCELAEY